MMKGKLTQCSFDHDLVLSWTKFRIALINIKLKALSSKHGNKYRDFRELVREVKECLSFYFPLLTLIFLSILSRRVPEIVEKDCVWSKKTVHRKREGASVAVPKLTVSKFHKYSLASIEYPHEGCTCTSIYTKQPKNGWKYLGYLDLLNI